MNRFEMCSTWSRYLTNKRERLLSSPFTWWFPTTPPSPRRLRKKRSQLLILESLWITTTLRSHNSVEIWSPPSSLESKCLGMSPFSSFLCSQNSSSSCYSLGLESSLRIDGLHLCSWSLTTSTRSERYSSSTTTSRWGNSSKRTNKLRMLPISHSSSLWLRLKSKRRALSSESKSKTKSKLLRIIKLRIKMIQKNWKTKSAKRWKKRWKK